MIQSTFSATKQSTSQASCEQANFPNSHYHINWNVRAMRVECPTNLTRVTGCKLNSQGLPQAEPGREGCRQRHQRLQERLHHDDDAGLLPADVRVSQ